MPLPYNWFQTLRNDPAQVQREMYTDAVAKNTAQRLPQMNRAEDLSIQGMEQNLSQSRKTNAQKWLGSSASAIAQSQTPLQAAKSFLSNPNWAAAAQEIGIDPAQFTLEGETDDTIRTKFTDWARAMGAQGGVTYQQYEGPGGSILQRSSTGEVSSVLGREPQSTAGQRQPPQGYRYKQDGSLEFEPGGPADPANNAMPLRKEFESVDVVKNYRNVLPLYQRATTAPDTMAGDISVIYALGKMFDPTSVVREGELQLSMNAAPWLQKIASMVNAQITGEGRLSAETRADIMGALRGQIDAFRAPYEQERARYSQYAQDSGLTPEKIIGPDPAAAFPQIGTQGTENKAQYLERLRREVATLEAQGGR